MAVYRPAATNHAVEQAIVGVRLLEPATEGAFSRACEFAKKIAPDRAMGGHAPIDQISILTRQTISQGYATQGPIYNGELFFSFNQSGQITEEVMVERSLITYRTHKYQRWANVQEIIGSVMLPILDALCEGDWSKIGVVELRCIDKFLANAKERPTLAALVRGDCPYVAPALLISPDLLHSHVGWFDEKGEGRRRLINVNVDLGDDGKGTRLASILQVISLQGATRGALFSATGDFARDLDGVFSELHQNDKFVLSKILTDELQNEIDLKGSTGLGRL